MMSGGAAGFELGATQAAPVVRSRPARARKQEAKKQEQVIRYGPGVPVTSGRKGQTAAEQLWQSGLLPRARRRGRLRRVLGALLTLALLAASAVVLYLRFHHPDLGVSDVKITQQTQNGCGVNVTGLISTNGAAGTVTYQWVFRGDTGAPVPQGQSVLAGQHSVSVTVAIHGTGHGVASQQVSLQVLGPDTGSATTTVQLRC
jgi:hypothetical protein